MLIACLSQRYLWVKSQGGAAHCLETPGLGGSRATQMRPAEGAPTHATQATQEEEGPGAEQGLLAGGVGLMKEMQQYLPPQAVRKCMSSTDLSLTGLLPGVTGPITQSISLEIDAQDPPTLHLPPPKPDDNSSLLLFQEGWGASYGVTL